MSESKEVKVVTIDPSVIEMSDAIDKAEWKIEKVDNKAVLSRADNVYFELAAREGLTTETLHKVKNFRERFVAAEAHSTSKASIDFCKDPENKGIDQVTSHVKLEDRDKMLTTFKKHITTPNMKNREEVYHTYGLLTTALDLSMDNKNAGYYGAVSQQSKNAAAAALKDL